MKEFRPIPHHHSHRGKVLIPQKESSYGYRHRTPDSGIKKITLRGGRMVLLNPQKVVELVLDRTLVNTLIPICYDLKTACEQVLQ